MDGVLTVMGECKANHDTAGKVYFIREVAYGAFQRSFELPEASTRHDRLRGCRKAWSGVLFKQGVVGSIPTRPTR